MSRTRGRELVLAVLLAAIGAGLTLLAVGQPWGHGLASSGALRVAVRASGREATPIPAGLGLLALAGVLAVLATRRLGRSVVGALLLAAGLGIAAAAAMTALDPAPAVDAAAAKAAAQTAARASAVTGTAWPWLAVLGGLLVAAGGAFTVVRGRSWPAMSARYEAPRGRGSDGAAARPASTAGEAGQARPASSNPRALATMWDALDRGDDPT
jgi:uncharacterized membrane protein (TIGR02234 family)